MSSVITSSAQAGAREEARPLGASDAGMRTMTWVTVLIVFTQKLAVPGTAGALQMAPFIFYAAMLYLLGKRQVRIAPLRLVLFMATISVSLLVHATYHGDKFSLPSLGFYACIYASSMFVMPATEAQYMKLLGTLQKVGIFAAVWVGIDWAVQFAGLPIPNLEALIPEPLLLKDFAYIRDFKWGSPFNKANGLIFLEPSHASQFLAFCLFIELCFFRRPLWAAMYFIAMFATYGGTGLLLCALSAPFALRYVRPSVAIGASVAAVVILIAAGAAGLLDEMLGRTGEFSTEGSSAYYRFVAPMLLISEVLNDTPLVALFGHGAGNSPKQNIFVIWIPIAKVLYEYGLVFAMVWLPLMLASTFGKGRVLIVSWMMFIQYHVLNGSLLVPINFLYCLLFSGLYVFEKQTAEEPSAVTAPASAPAAPAGEGIAHVSLP